MSVTSDLMQYVWLFLALIVAVLQITAAVILLKDRHMGAWLILTGAVTLFLPVLGSNILMFVLNKGNVSLDLISAMARSIGTLSFLGSLLIALGLLLHALRQRAKANRIAELEMIIADLQKQR